MRNCYKCNLGGGLRLQSKTLHCCLSAGMQPKEWLLSQGPELVALTAKLHIFMLEMELEIRPRFV